MRGMFVLFEFFKIKRAEAYSLTDKVLLDMDYYKAKSIMMNQNIHKEAKIQLELPNQPLPP